MNPVTQFENTQAHIRRADPEKFHPDINRFERELMSVEPVKRLSLLQQSNALGTFTHCATSRRYGRAIDCIIAALEPDKRLPLFMVRDDCGVTAIHIACKEGYLEIARSILESVSDEDQISLLKIRDTAGYTALHCAAANNQDETIASVLDIIDKQKHVELLSIQNRRKQNVQETAVQYNGMRAVDCIKEYLEESRREARRKLKRKPDHDAEKMAKMEKSLEEMKKLCQRLMNRIVATERKVDEIPFQLTRPTSARDGGDSGDEIVNLPSP